MSSPERRVVLKEDEYLVPITTPTPFPTPPTFPPRIPTRPLMTIVSRYVIHVGDLTIEKTLTLLKIIKETFQDLFYNAELHENELIIYLKTRKIEKIENKLKELKETIK